MEGWSGQGPPDDDALITAVASACNKSGTRVVVVAVSPGAVLTPWRDSVHAVVAAFMPGQEYGNAIVDLLWGNTSPTARLPMTFPASENQWNFGPSQWPGINLHSNYTEGLLVGYRYYDALKLEPAYPFGHGLSYTTFSYSDLKVSARSVTFTLKNQGSRDGTEVPQLYLSFPADAGEPPLQLKGFKPVAIPKGGSVDVTLPFEDRAVSIYDIGIHDWKVFPGTFQAHVGASSRDIRLTGSFDVKSPQVVELY